MRGNGRMTNITVSAFSMTRKEMSNMADGSFHISGNIPIKFHFLLIQKFPIQQMIIPIVQLCDNVAQLFSGIFKGCLLHAGKAEHDHRISSLKSAVCLLLPYRREVWEALKEYGLYHTRQKVKDWYDGFTFVTSSTGLPLSPHSSHSFSFSNIHWPKTGSRQHFHRSPMGCITRDRR